MFATFKSGYPDHNDSTDGELLRDIEEISKSLYFENRTQVNSLVSFSKFGPKLAKNSNSVDFKSKSKHGYDKDNELLKEEQKNLSIWGWKPFKALSHIRQRKFNCCFFCHVHCIDDLMLDFNDNSMCVVWKRKDTVLRTRPSRVSNGLVEFEETLMSKCTVYGAKEGSGNFVKYEPKHFLLYAFVIGAEGVEVGKHWVDLTRLLPVTLEELEQDNCSGKWSTSFKLVGKAQGATLHVSFGFLVTKDGLVAQSGLSRMSSADYSAVRNNTTLRRVGSVPSSLTNGSFTAKCLNVRNGMQTDLYDFSNSISMLYGKLEEESVDSPNKINLATEHLESLHLVSNSLSGSGDDVNGDEHDGIEFTVVEKGIELDSSCKEEIDLNDSLAGNFEVSSVEVIDIAEIFKDDGICSDEESKIIRLDEAFSCGQDALPVKKYCVADTKESNVEEKEDFSLSKIFIQQFDESEDEMSVDNKVKYKGNNIVKSLSLDNIAKVVADDFCNMLEDVHSPSPRNSNALESPRERLLRQFEEDMINSGSLFLDVDVKDHVSDYEYEAPSVSSSDYIIESVGLSPIFDIAGHAANESVQESLRNKLKAKSLERLETQTLLQRWGLKEEDLLDSPYYSNGGFGSPIFIPPEEPVGLPPLAEGLEALLHLEDGGCLRTMSPLLFQKAKHCGPLIIQTSKTLVLPVELGSDIMDILQCLASIGSDRLFKKLHSLMPLKNLSGKTMQQLAWEASCNVELLERPLHHESDIKIEVEGHPCFQDCNHQSLSLTGSILESNYVAAKDLALLALDSIEAPIIEGLKIQSGMADRDAPSSIRMNFTSEVGLTEHMVAYFDGSSDFVGAKGTAEYINELLDLSISLDEWLRLDSGKSCVHEEDTEMTLNVLRAHHANLLGRESNCGVLGDDLTLAIIMQLRDLQRNYEPVGGPMLGLIQVKRLIKPLAQVFENDRIRKDLNYRFRLEEVHVGGFNLESNNYEMWSTNRQQQAGSRWLLASGLTKSGKPRFSKSRSIMKLPTQVARKPWVKSFIWSVSRPICGVAVDPSQDPLTRNPDVIFPQ